MAKRIALFSVTYLHHGSCLWRTKVVRGHDAVRAFERRLRLQYGLRRSTKVNRSYGIFHTTRIAKEAK